MANLDEFTEMLAEHHASLRYFIQGLGVNPSWVDDVAQDVFLIAYRKWDELLTVENPGAWLRAVARNVVWNETAKLNRRQRLMDENLTTLLIEAADPTLDNGLTRLDLSSRREDLQNCLKLLPAKSAEVIQARYFRDWNATRIGEHLSLKPAAVRKILFNARQALAQCLSMKEKFIPPAR